MPVTTSYVPDVSTANGVTTVFPYNFTILDQTHLVVVVNGVEKTLTADYTVSGVGNPTGGNVTFVTAPANGATVTRLRRAPYRRATDYQHLGSLREDTLDPDLDLLAMQIQQLAQQSLKVPESEAADATATTIPSVAQRKSNFFGWDANGKPIAVATTVPSASVSAFIATLLDDPDAATARNTLGVNPLLPKMNWGGLIFDGSTNYLDGNPLTGITDTKKGTFVWFGKFDNTASAVENIIGNDSIAAGRRFGVNREADGSLRVVARNAAGTVIMDCKTSSTVAAAAGVYTVLCSFDLAAAGSFMMYVNGVDQAITETTFSNDTIDYTTAEWSIGADTTGTAKFDGVMYLLALDQTQNLNFDTESVRRKLIDTGNEPVFMGPFGNLPFGLPPILFMAYDGADAWFEMRRGSNTSTWVPNGTFGAASFPLAGNALTGQYGSPVMRVLVSTTALPAAATADILVINTQTAARILVVLQGVSFDTATRRLEVLFNEETSAYAGIHHQDTATQEVVSAFFARAALQAASETTAMVLSITGFHQGLPGVCDYAFQSAQGGVTITGSGRVAKLNLNGMTKLRLRLNGSGNFDGGTYQVIGID